MRTAKEIFVLLEGAIAKGKLEMFLSEYPDQELILRLADGERTQQMVNDALVLAFFLGQRNAMEQLIREYKADPHCLLTPILSFISCPFGDQDIQWLTTTFGTPQDPHSPSLRLRLLLVRYMIFLGASLNHLFLDHYGRKATAILKILSSPYAKLIFYLPPDTFDPLEVGFSEEGQPLTLLDVVLDKNLYAFLPFLPRIGYEYTRLTKQTQESILFYLLQIPEINIDDRRLREGNEVFFLNRRYRHLRRRVGEEKMSTRPLEKAILRLFHSYPHLIQSKGYRQKLFEEVSRRPLPQLALFLLHQEGDSTYIKNNLFSLLLFSIAMREVSLVEDLIDRMSEFSQEETFFLVEVAILFYEENVFSLVMKRIPFLPEWRHSLLRALNYLSDIIEEDHEMEITHKVKETLSALLVTLQEKGLDINDLWDRFRYDDLYESSWHHVVSLLYTLGEYKRAKEFFSFVVGFLRPHEISKVVASFFGMGAYDILDIIFDATLYPEKRFFSYMMRGIDEDINLYEIIAKQAYERIKDPSLTEKFVRWVNTLAPLLPKEKKKELFTTMLIHEKNGDLALASFDPSFLSRLFSSHDIPSFLYALQIAHEPLIATMKKYNADNFEMGSGILFYQKFFPHFLESQKHQILNNQQYLSEEPFRKVWRKYFPLFSLQLIGWLLENYPHILFNPSIQETETFFLVNMTPDIILQWTPASLDFFSQVRETATILLKFWDEILFLVLMRYPSLAPKLARVFPHPRLEVFRKETLSTPCPGGRRMQTLWKAWGWDERCFFVAVQYEDRDFLQFWMEKADYSEIGHKGPRYKEKLIRKAVFWATLEKKNTSLAFLLDFIPEKELFFDTMKPYDPRMRGIVKCFLEEAPPRLAKRHQISLFSLALLAKNETAAHLIAQRGGKLFLEDSEGESPIAYAVMGSSQQAHENITLLRMIFAPTVGWWYLYEHKKPFSDQEKIHFSGSWFVKEMQDLFHRLDWVQKQGVPIGKNSATSALVCAIASQSISFASPTLFVLDSYYYRHSRGSFISSGKYFSSEVVIGTKVIFSYLRRHGASFTDPKRTKETPMQSLLLWALQSASAKKFSGFFFFVFSFLCSEGASPRETITLSQNNGQEILNVWDILVEENLQEWLTFVYKYGVVRGISS